MQRPLILAAAGAVLAGAAVIAQAFPETPAGASGFGPQATGATSAQMPQPTTALAQAPPVSIAPVVESTANAAAGGGLPAQYTRLVVFSIPFEAPPATLRAMEVQLYFTADQGRSWSLYGKASPSAGQFTFRAPRDGDYWFFVRTLDDRGNLHPTTIGQPEMRVVVDTVPPRLELKVERGPAGEIRGSWRVDDPLLKIDGVQLSCGAGTPDATWQSLVAPPLVADAQATSGTAESTWWIDASKGPLVIRAEVVDRAGNTLVAQEQVPGSAAASASPAPVSAPSSPPAPPRAWAPNEVSAAGPVHAGPAAEAAPPAALPPAPVASAVEAPVAAQFPIVPPTANATAEPGPSPAPNVPTPSPPPPVEDRPLTIDEIPAGVVPRWINSLRFELHSDLAPIAGDGIRAVELWGTRDGGLHWIGFGQSSDTRAPLVMTVNSEGVYGFRVRAFATAGPVGPAPQNGDTPDIWVVIDTKAPTARLTRIDYGQGPQAECVTIGWEASDTRLASRPVSLDYSSQVAGPWTAIAAELPNSGAYLWRTESRLPPRVYLRLSVRDEAGNVTSVQTPEAATLPRATPAGRIIDVRPLAR